MKAISASQLHRAMDDLEREERRRLANAYFLGGDYEESSTADEVVDAGPAERVDTGLLDADGNPIYRRRQAVKFGFVP